MATVAPELRLRYQNPTGQLREFARSSPARLIAIAVALISCCLIGGTMTAREASTRQVALHDLLEQSEPFLNSTQQLYGALSTADAAAGTAFLYNGREPVAVHDRYTAAIDRAAVQLADSTDGDGSGEWLSLCQGIAAALPEYTGLVETARTEDRDRHPVGAAYLGEASHLMQTTLLPMAQDLHNRQSAAVIATQRQFDAPPWAAIVLLVLVLVALVLAQIHLARRSRRRLNRGLLTATALLLALLVWLGGAGLLSAMATSRAADHGTTPLSALSDARNMVQQARTAETLNLVRHDTSAGYDKAFAVVTGRLNTMLTDYPTGIPGTAQVRAARAGLTQWIDAHKRISAHVATGDFSTAALIAIGPGTHDAAAAFAVVDSSLLEGITAVRDELRHHVAVAADDLTLLGRGTLLLSAAAAVAVVAGLWPRVREYL